MFTSGGVLAAAPGLTDGDPNRGPAFLCVFFCLQLEVYSLLLPVWLMGIHTVLFLNLI
jgi:hypothetical protein